MKKKLKKPRKQRLSGRLRSIWVFGFIATVFIWLAYVGLERKLRTALLDKSTTRTKAIIIDQRHYWGNSPVSSDFSFFYQFTVDNNIYKGKSWDKGLNIGDSLEIEYVQIYPSFNRPTNRK